MWYSGVLQNLFVEEQVITMFFFIEALSWFNSRIIDCKITYLEVMRRPGRVVVRIVGQRSGRGTCRALSWASQEGADPAAVRMGGWGGPFFPARSPFPALGLFQHCLPGPCPCPTPPALHGLSVKPFSVQLEAARAWECCTPRPTNLRGMVAKRLSVCVTASACVINIINRTAWGLSAGHSHAKYQTRWVKSVPANFHTDKTGPGRERKEGLRHSRIKGLRETNVSLSAMEG